MVRVVRVMRVYAARRQHVVVVVVSSPGFTEVDELTNQLIEANL